MINLLSLLATPFSAAAMDLPPASGGPANDECSGAVAITNGMNGPFSNVGATTSAEPSSCGVDNEL